MSDANTAPNGAATTTATTTTEPATAPAAAPAPAAAQAAADTAPAQTAEPAWLKARLEQAERSALHKLGVTDVEAAKKVLAEANALAESRKTAEQKAVEAANEARVAKAEAERLAATVTETSARMLVGLTDEQRAAVIQIAGDDPSQRIRTIHALQPVWAKVAPAPAAAPAAAPAPASTAPIASQPGDGTTSPVNHRAVYEQTRESNPFAAAIHGMKHSADVYRPHS